MTQAIIEQKFSSLLVINQTAKSILNKGTGFIKNYDFTLNPYRGCQYGCSYCYASAFSPNQQMRQDWGKWVIIKENAAELLGKELEKLKKKQLTPPSIYMSSVTDPYQPIETKTLLIISRVNSPPLGAYEKSKKELQYPAACGGVVYLDVFWRFY